MKETKNCCLIVTSSIDETVDYIINHYGKQFNVFRLDVDRFPLYEFYIRDSKDWCIVEKTTGSRIAYFDVKSIYFRKIFLPNMEAYDEKYRGLIAKDILTLITGLVDAFDGKVLTKPYILRKTENKVFQMLYVNYKKILCPVSYIGNSTKLVKQFADARSIIKPLSVGRLQYQDDVETYSTGILGAFDEDIALTPVYVQEYVEKSYEVRITIIADRVYAVKIVCDNKIDWRLDYKSHIYEIIECPKDIKKMCIEMLKDFNLVYGAFDFIVSNDERWYFLEVNPNGQWLWLELALNLDISREIINYLKQ